MKFIYKIVILASLLLVGKFAMAQTALDFNGANQWVDMGALPSLSNFTVEFDINHNGGDAGYDRFVSGIGNSFCMATDNVGTVKWYSTNLGNGWTNMGYTMPGNTWQHMAWVYNGVTLALYVNGVFVNQIGTNGNSLSATSWYIAANQANFTENANVIIDNFRLWDDARTAGEILTEYQNCLLGTEANLTVLYDFEEGVGTVLNDLATNNGMQNGNIVNAPIWVAGMVCAVATPTSDLKIVNNNNAYIRLNGGANFIVNDSLPGVFVAAGAGNGYLSSEGENNVVKWNIGDKTGNYTVPFNTKWSTNIFIPVSIDVTTAGSADGNIVFSTYETTTDMNIPWASDVTNMNSGILGGADGSLFAIDRFWRIDANSYTSKPSATISLGYDDAANEMGGTNTITEANLRAQYFDVSTGNWEGMEGVINTTTNVVSSIPVTTASFNKTWILVDNTTPLPIHLDYFNVLCENNKSTLYWESNSDYANIEIHNSVNGKEWNIIANLTDNETSWVSNNDKNGKNFRLKFTTQNGEEYISEIIASDCDIDKFEVLLYPNPTTDEINFQLSDKYKDSKLTIYNSIGEHIANFDLNTIKSISMNDYSKGTYHFFFYHSDGNTLSKSVIKL